MCAGTAASGSAKRCQWGIISTGPGRACHHKRCRPCFKSRVISPVSKSSSSQHTVWRGAPRVAPGCGSRTTGEVAATGDPVEALAQHQDPSSFWVLVPAGTRTRNLERGKAFVPGEGPYWQGHWTWKQVSKFAQGCRGHRSETGSNPADKGHAKAWAAA